MLVKCPYASVGRRVPRRVSYALIAAVLAIGAPLGLLVVRALTASASADLVKQALSDDLPTFLYVTLSTLVVFSAFGYSLGRQADALADLALTDPLTGLRNRRAFDQRLADELERAVRYVQPLSLLLFDVDGLKAVNDRGGHHAGDVSLRAVAAALRQDARRTDLAARVGGDEFALIAPGTTRPAALALAERIRSLVAEKGTPHGVTVSVGVATLGQESAAAAPMFEAADLALYEAKRGGRNRVVAGRDGALGAGGRS